MLDDFVERRAALLEMLDEKHVDRRAVEEQLTTIEDMLGILDERRGNGRHKDPLVEEWEAAFVRGGPMPTSLTQGADRSKKNPSNR